MEVSLILKTLIQRLCTLNRLCKFSIVMNLGKLNLKHNEC